MPLDEKQKEKLMIFGGIAAVVGLFLALKSAASSSVAGQSLAGNRAPTPGSPGYPNNATNDLGKAYLDYQFKNQQLTAQTALANAQLASTDARAKMANDTSLQVAAINASSKMQSSAMSSPMSNPANWRTGTTPDKGNPNADGSNNKLPPPDGTGTYGWTSPNYGKAGYGVIADTPGSPGTMGGIPGYSFGKASTEANAVAKDAQIFGPPSSPASPGEGWPSINGLIGNDQYQTSPILNWLTMGSADIPYEGPGSVSPVISSPYNASDYFSAPDFTPSFAPVGFNYGSSNGDMADLGSGGSFDSASNDVGFEGEG